jgi:hypothetical protein
MMGIAYTAPPMFFFLCGPSLKAAISQKYPLRAKPSQYTCTCEERIVLSAAVGQTKQVEEERKTVSPITHLYSSSVTHTGPIHIKSRVMLNIESGATIIGSDKQEDYPGRNSDWFVVSAWNATDVGERGWAGGGE